MSHIFSTLVSVNQQENVYEIDDGIYVAGPKPEEYEINNVMPGSTDSKGILGVQIQTIIADLTDTDLFRSRDVICQNVNCIMRSAHGLSKSLSTAYPYGSVYLKNNDEKRNVLPDNLLREPGKCILKTSEDDRPMIANITGQTYFGKAVDNGGHQIEYLNKYGLYCGEKLTNYLKTDTLSQRIYWFEKGLKELKDKIEAIKSPLNIYFPKLIGCDSAGGDIKNIQI